MLKKLKSLKDNKRDYIWADARSQKAAAIITSIICVGIIGGVFLYTETVPKVSTCYYHFNLQYKMGDDTTYDNIIMSMAHVAWMYENHTSWHYSIETQFLTLEYMHEYFPGIFELFREQNQRGQMELVVPQYSDAWHIAYPEKDFAESVNYTMARMKEWGLKRSGVVVLQEGQWLPGCPAIADVGDFKAFVIHREQLGYWGSYYDEPVLEWTYNGKSTYAFVIPRMPTTEGGFYHAQIYSADGELLNTGDVEVDVGEAETFAYNEEKQENHENHLIQMEKAGNKFLTMDEFIDLMIENGAVGKLDKFIPECEWVPNQYDTFFKWMGDGSGSVDDGTILARNYWTRNYVQATEVFLNHALEDDVINRSQWQEWGPYRFGGKDGLLLEAKKDVWYAQVSDTTGINPKIYEWWAAMNKTYSAYELCNEIIDNVRNAAIGTPLEGFYNSTLQINPFLSYEHQVLIIPQKINS